jgi:hypothetical protein
MNSDSSQDLRLSSEDIDLLIKEVDEIWGKNKRLAEKVAQAKEDIPFIKFDPNYIPNFGRPDEEMYKGPDKKYYQAKDRIEGFFKYDQAINSDTAMGEE